VTKDVCEMISFVTCGCPSTSVHSADFIDVDDVYLYRIYIYIYCLQCFDAVGWAAGRASGL